MSKNTNAIYEVLATITVDNPHLRGSQYIQVAQGTKIPQGFVAKSFNHAISYYNEVLQGDYEFGSEYTSFIQIIRRVPGSFKKTNVRKPVYRNRQGVVHYHR